MHRTAAGECAAPVASLRDAVEAATAAGTPLLTVECSEDLALAIAAYDPSDPGATDLVTAATDDRNRMGAPRPGPRVEALLTLTADGATDQALR